MKDKPVKQNATDCSPLSSEAGHQCAAPVNREFASVIDLDSCVPHDVIRIQVRQRSGLLSAWRCWRGLTQEEVARALGTMPSVVAQWEAADMLPETDRVKLAALYQCHPNQLI